MSGNPPSTKEFNTQQTSGFRRGMPEWIRQLPALRFSRSPNQNYQFIKRDGEEWKKLTDNLEPDVMKRINEDIDFLEYELLRLFRDRDFKAASNQNQYRTYQISFMLLAAIATIIGALQGISVGTAPNLVPWLAFFETVVALSTTYLATISGREPPLPLWLNNRRRAEYLRREYFRFLGNLPPYDVVEGFRRKQLLSERAADINRGIYPDKTGDE